MKRISSLALLASLFALSCSKEIQSPNLAAETVDAARYWHQGTAEISRFSITQARYGNTYTGDAILIFVKEDFLPVRQVKYEGRSTGESPVPILKLISTREFITGIYPYSIMTSVFAPFASNGRSYKITGTTQDWCGQTFMQLNNNDTAFAVTYRSYFEDEGDRNFIVGPEMLEDELFIMARTNPRGLPVGEISMLPSVHCVQLRIKEFYPHTGTATRSVQFIPELSADSVQVYSIRYHDVPRVFSIIFEQRFPHTILAWEETEGNLNGDEPPLMTRAVRTHTIMSDYWNKSAPADSVLRKSLGL